MYKNESVAFLIYCHQFSEQWRGDFDGYVNDMREWWVNLRLSPEERHLLNHLADGGKYNPVWPERGEPFGAWLGKWPDDTRAVLGDGGKLYLYFNTNPRPKRR